MTRRSFLLSSGACALAQDVKTKAEIRGNKIVEDALAALGGNNFLTMADRTESGRAFSYYHDEISGLSLAKVFTKYKTIPASKSEAELGQIEKETYGKTEDTSVIFQLDKGWDVSWRGSKQMEPDRFDRYREWTLRNVLYIFRMRLREPGMIYEFQTSDVIDNLPVDIVDITDSENRVIHVHFHQSTKLPVRQVYKRKNEETKEQDDEVTLFTRYLDAGGVQWPHQIRRERNGYKSYEIFSDSVKINSGLEDSFFTVEGTTPGKPGAKPKKK
jgi:hypothetical protein